MSFLDKVKKVVSDNEDKIEDGIDKVADLVDDKVPAKHADKVHTAADKAKEALKKLD